MELTEADERLWGVLFPVGTETDENRRLYHQQHRQQEKVESLRQQKQKLRITNRKLHFGSFYKLSRGRMRQVRGQRKQKK